MPELSETQEGLPGRSVLVALLVLLLTSCSVRTSPGGTSAGFDALRADNGLLAAPQLFIRKPSAEQTVYRMMLELVAAGDVARLDNWPSAGATAELIRQQAEGVNRIWLLHLAGTFYREPLVRQSDVDELGMLVDPAGGLAPDHQSVGQVSTDVIDAATLKAFQAARGATLSSPDLDRAVKAVRERSGSPAADALGGRADPATHRPIRRATTDGGLPELYFSHLAGEPVTEEAVAAWLARFENGTISSDEPGLLWLLSEVISAGSYSETTVARLRTAIRQMNRYPRTEGWFYAEPRTITGDPVATYVALTTAAGRGYSVVDAALGDALERTTAETERTKAGDGLLKAVLAVSKSYSRTGAPGHVEVRLPSWVASGDQQADRNLLLFALVSRHSGVVPPEHVRQSWPRSSPIEAARSALATWIVTDAVPSWFGEAVGSWRSALTKAASNDERFVLLAALLASPDKGQRAEIRAELDAALRSESGCGGVPWIVRLAPSVAECDLRSSLSATLAFVAADRDRALRLFEG